MTNIIYYERSLVASWMDAIEATFNDPLLKLVACRDNTLAPKAVSSYSGTNITLSDTTGLFPGSLIRFVLNSGTMPPEIDESGNYYVQSVVGNVIQIGHAIASPAIFLTAGTNSLTLFEIPLNTKTFPASYDYYKMPVADALGANIDWLPLVLTRTTSGSLEVVRLTNTGFRRGSTATDPFTIKHYAIVLTTVDETATDSILATITLDPVEQLSGTQVVTFNADLLSQETQ